MAKAYPTKSCECGCGEPIQSRDARGRVRRFVKGHFRRGRKFPGKGAKQPSLEERFWRNVRKSDGCWWWIGGKCSKGYGSIMADGRIAGAHRVAYELHIGPIPNGISVCHSCDNPACVNPSHLWLGTNLDNTRDRDRKGRGRWAGNITNAHLSERDAKEIRKLCAEGMQQKDCAALFGVHKATVNDLVLRKTWRHV